MIFYLGYDNTGITIQKKTFIGVNTAKILHFYANIELIIPESFTGANPIKKC